MKRGVSLFVWDVPVSPHIVKKNERKTCKVPTASLKAKDHTKLRVKSTFRMQQRPWNYTLSEVSVRKPLTQFLSGTCGVIIKRLQSWRHKTTNCRCNCFINNRHFVKKMSAISAISWLQKKSSSFDLYRKYTNEQQAEKWANKTKSWNLKQKHK